MNRITTFALTAALSLSVVPFAMADDSHHAAASVAGKATGANAAMTDGEIRKIDKSAGKMTIKHGELKSLDMPPMTMVFLVKDKAMLDEVNVGDKIDFVAEKVGGKLTVTKIVAKP